MDEASGSSMRWMDLAARNPERAWELFLDAYSPVLLQVVGLFERDADRAGDCFLWVCDHLRRDALVRLRRFRSGGAASFATWLRAVARNLCIDWHRHRFHRFRLPRSIARLPELEREAFRCVHQRGLSETETLHSLTPLFPALTRIELTDALTRVERSLDSRQSWGLLTRHPRLEPIAARGAETGSVRIDREPCDDRVDLEGSVAEREILAALGAALRNLEPPARLLVRMRFEGGLSFDEIARLTGQASAACAQRAVGRALDQLRTSLAERDRSGRSVRED